MAAGNTGESCNDKQELFCQHYVICWNIGEAAKQAGYNRRYGYMLMEKPHIVDRISQIQLQTGINMVINKTKVMRETAYLAYSDITDTLGCSTIDDLKNLPENVRKAIRKIKINRTPIRRVGGGERGAQSNSGALAACGKLENGADSVDNPVENILYEESIEIEMHPKSPAQRLLAEMTAGGSGGVDPNGKTTKFIGVKLNVLQKPKDDEKVTTDE